MPEVILAIGIFSLSMVTLLAALGTGLGSAKSVSDDYQSQLILHNVQSRLSLDPSWPGTDSAHTFGFSSTGVELPSEDDGNIQVRLTRLPANPHWESSHLETFQIEILDLNGTLLESALAARIKP